MPNPADGGVRAVARALQVMDCFDVEGAAPSIADLVRRTGLPRTTVLRLVETLVGEGMLDGAEDGRVRPGPRLFTWAALARSAWTLPEATSRRLADLAVETGETASVYVRRGLRRVAVGQAPSPHSLRHVVQVGDEIPLWGGASAVLLLALEPVATADELVERLAAEPDAPPAAAELPALVADARGTGWVVSHGVREAGNSGIAVPVPALPGGRRPVRPVVLALGGPTARFTDDRIDGFVEALRAAARDVAVTGLPPALH